MNVAPPARPRRRGLRGMQLATAAMLALILVASYFKGLRPPHAEGDVTGIADGDTLRVFVNGQHEKVRLFGIDCPELRQPFGDDAKAFAAERVKDRTVRLAVKDKDEYGRLVAEVYYAPADAPQTERCLNEELVRAGWAWAYRRYSTQYAPQEEEARAARRGLWKTGNAVPPWEFRLEQNDKP
ncbi:MAG: thermonuclease family protein [Planctomycetota bacterium]|nr:thermonuclease family protein [Planctomycetota bacterium]